MTGPVARKSFGSDNHSGTHPAVMSAIIDANTGDAVAYGADPWTERATAELRRLSGASGEGRSFASTATYTLRETGR